MKNTNSSPAKDSEEEMQKKIQFLKEKVATLEKENSFLQAELKEERDLLKPYMCNSNWGERFLKRLREYLLPSDNSAENHYS